jgi:phosphoglycerol transferase MdoB-like AlkP superfamily enzyme
MKDLRQYIYGCWDILLLFVSLSLKILVYAKFIKPDYFSYSYVIRPVVSSALIVCSVLFLIENKRRLKLVLLYNLVISILIICDLNYYRYFKDIPSLSVVRNGLLLGPVKSSIASLFKVDDLLFLCDVPLMLSIFKMYRKKIQAQSKLAFRFFSFIIILVLGVQVNYKYFNKLSVEQPKLLTTMFNRVYIANELGILNAHGVDIYNEVRNSIERNTKISNEEIMTIKSFLNTNSESSSVKFSGAAQGRNLIMIQVEALQEFVINKSVDGKEITPNLNRWIKKSAYFNNFYYQVSAGGTSDAEFMSNNSLYPAPSGAAYYLYYNNEYNSIGNMLKKKGYDTAAFHGFKGTFWNRDVMYKSEGFNTFYSEMDYNVDSKIGLGLSDDSFFNQSLDKIKALKEPYYAFLITLSSHFPYDDRKGYGEFISGDLKDTLMGDYLNAIHYTDEAIGKFLDNLEKNSMLSDTILVIYGDHSAIPKDNEQELAKFMKVDNFDELQWTKLQKVPMLIHFPKDKHRGIYNNYGGQIDIYPTLSNLLSIENEDVIGKDLFNSTGNTVIFRNGSFINSNVYYSSQSGAYYNTNTKVKIEETEDLKTLKNFSVTQLEYSDEILKHNLIKKYNGNME